MGRNGQEAATPDLWTQVRAAMRERIGQNNCLTWIDPMQLRGISEGVARFAVPTRFIGDWVSRHFAEDLVQEFVRAGARVTRIEWSVSRPGRPLDTAPPPAAPNDPARSGPHSTGLQSTGLQSTGPRSTGPRSTGPRSTAPQPPASPAARAPAGANGPELPSAELPGSPLDARFTFDSFVVGKPNELAHAAARRVAEAGPVAFNPLFLYGGVGLGKTHLMHAIAWELRQKPGLRVLYVSAEQFMYRFIDALRNKSVMDFKQLFRSVDVLLVDDVQFIAGKDNTQEEFFHTFNALVDQGRQIVISADCAPGEIKDLEDRIISRLQWGLVVDLHPTDYELRLGILQQKMEGYLRDDPTLRVEPQVLEFLAHKITTNVRVLEGALTRLHAFASLVGREITLELAQDCLADILRVSERRVTIEEIQRKVAEHYNIRLADMIGPKRVRTLARPRQVAMYLSKELTSRSLPEIGRRFGGRDHTTIIHGVRKVEQLMGDDPQLAEDLRLLRRLLSS